MSEKPGAGQDDPVPDATDADASAEVAGDDEAGPAAHETDGAASDAESIDDDAPTPAIKTEVTETEGKLTVIEPDASDLEIIETQAQVEKRKKETEDAPPRPKSQMGIILIMVAVVFIMIDPNLRELAGNTAGLFMGPFEFGGQMPVLTIIVAGTIMITLSTIVRHFFMDWIKMARTQNTMRAFQKEFNKARRERDQKRINELTKAQQQLMGLQAEMSGSQMKPMAVTMLVVIPMFAWLWTFVSALDYHWFSTPWNLRVDMFTTEGILFGTSVLPHWILLYSVLSIPFGQLLQKGLKVWSWRKRVDHILSDQPDVHEPDAE